MIEKSDKLFGYPGKYEIVPHKDKDGKEVAMIDFKGYKKGEMPEKMEDKLLYAEVFKKGEDKATYEPLDFNYLKNSVQKWGGRATPHTLIYFVKEPYREETQLISIALGSHHLSSLGMAFALYDNNNKMCMGPEQIT